MVSSSRFVFSLQGARFRAVGLGVLGLELSESLVDDRSRIVCEAVLRWVGSLVISCKYFRVNMCSERDRLPRLLKSSDSPMLGDACLA